MAGCGTAGRFGGTALAIVLAAGCGSGHGVLPGGGAAALPRGPDASAPGGGSPADAACAVDAGSATAPDGGARAPDASTPASGLDGGARAPDAGPPARDAGAATPDGGAGGMLGGAASCADRVTAATNGVCYGTTVKWCWENPYPSGEDVVAVGGSSADDIWVLTPSKVVHGRAGVWTDVMDARLLGGAFYAPAPDDVWLAAGHEPSYVEYPENVLSDTGSNFTPPSVWRWDGATWTLLTQLTVPDSGGLDVTGIWGSSDHDVYVSTMGRKNAGLFHFDGQQWTTVPALPEYPTSSFASVWGTGPSDVWTTELTQPGLAGRVYHYDGQSWQPLPFQLPFGHLGKLSAVPGSELWVGYSTGVGRFDGDSLVDMTPGPPTTASDFFTPLVLGPADVWALASQTDSRSPNCTVAHWDGLRWIDANVQPDPSQACYGTAVGWPRGGLVAGGRDGRLDALLCRGDFAPLTRPVAKANLRAVAVTGPNDLWAVGDAYTLLHGDTAGHWQQPWQSTIKVDLHAVWASGPDDVWAVGEAGSAYHFDGRFWLPRTTPANSALVAVSGTGPSDVWAVQSQPGAMLHFDGTTWTATQTGFEKGVYDVAAIAPNDVWAVGAAGFVHFDGTTWTTTPPLVADAIPEHVKAFATDDVWADAPARWVFHYDGHGWRTVATGELPREAKTAGYGPFITEIGGDPAVRKPYFLMQGELQPDGDVAELAADGTLRRLPKSQTATGYDGIAVAGQNIWLVGEHGAIEHATLP